MGETCICIHACMTVPPPLQVFPQVLATSQRLLPPDAWHFSDGRMAINGSWAEELVSFLGHQLRWGWVMSWTRWWYNGMDGWNHVSLVAFAPKLRILGIFWLARNQPTVGPILSDFQHQSQRFGLIELRMWGSNSMVVRTGKTRMRSNIAQSKGVHLPSAMKVPFFKHSTKCDKGSHVSPETRHLPPFVWWLSSVLHGPHVHLRHRLDPTRVKKNSRELGMGMMEVWPDIERVDGQNAANHQGWW